MKNKSKLKVVELFAGVGGFRLGLEGWKGKSSLSQYTKRLKKIMKLYGAINGSLLQKLSMQAISMSKDLEKKIIVMKIFIW